MPDNDYTAIEFPSSGAEYDREEFGVYKYSTYEESSVLAGQQKRSFLDSFKTLEEAKAAYPDAEWSGNEGTGYQEIVIPREPPEWFDPANAGEVWSEEDY